MPIRKLAATFLVLLCLFCAAIPVASAATCNALRSTLREARKELIQARSEANLTRAKRDARQADQSLDRAAKQALDCACSKAHRGFRSAAVYARRARIARDTQQFSSALNRSFHEFDAANRALRRCGRNS